MFKKKEKESAFLKNASMGLLFEKNDIDGRDDDNNNSNSNDNDIDEYNDDGPDQVNNIPDHNNDESNNNGVDDNMMYDDLIHSLPVPPSTTTTTTGGGTTGTSTTTTTTASRVIPSKQKKRYNLDPTVLLTPSDKHKSVSSSSSSTNNLHKQQQQQIPNIINDSDIAFLIQCNQKCSDDDYMMKPIVSSEDGFTLKCEMHSERLDLNHSESRGMVIVRSVGVVPYQLCDVVNSVMDTSLPQTLSLVNVPVDYYSTSSDNNNNNNNSKRYSTTTTSSNLSPYSISVSRMTMTFTDNGGNNNNNNSGSSSSELMNNNNKIDAEEMSKRRRSSVMKNASSILQYSSHQVSSPSSASPSSSSSSSSSTLHRAALMNSQLPQSSSVGIDAGAALGQQFLFSVPIVLDYCVASSAVYDSIHNRFITLHKSCSHPKAKPLANNHSVIRSSLFTGTIYEAVGQTSDEHMTRYTTITLVRTQDFFNKKRNVRRAFETQAMEMYADLINKCRANHARGFIAPKRVAGMYSTLLDYERNCLDKSLQEKRNPWDTYNQSTEYF